MADAGMSPVGVVVTPNKPSFPNKPLIIIGSFVLGLALGLVLAILIELLNRRVRGVEDLEFDRNLNCLAIVGPAMRERPVRNARSAGRRNAVVGASA